jgi:pimeloyl-ACP methyl ester carboxylesterase
LIASSRFRGARDYAAERALYRTQSELENCDMTIIRKSRRIVVGMLAAASMASCFAQQPAAKPATAGAGAARPLQVRVEGAGPPMILIPGLTCDGSVWDQTVNHFKGRYQCHVLSPAGFAGVPPVDGPFIPTMQQAIVQYIRENRLQKPVIMGHSLGGHLALAVAVAAPQEVGPIIVVDGAPATGVLMSPGASKEAIARQTEVMCNAMAAMSQQAFTAQNRMMMARLVQSSATAELLSNRAAKSDVKTVARAMQELMSADLRDAVAGIRSPVLLIGAADYAKDEATRAAVRGGYEAQVAKIPNHKLVMAYDSRHFVMLDVPQWFYNEVEAFLKTSM